MTHVWCADDTFLGEMIFLDDHSLIVDAPDEADVPRIRDALLGGSTPASVLSSDSTNIPLLSITRIAANRHDEDIEITYKKGRDTDEKTLRLASKEKRDEVYARLKAAFGDKFKEYEDAYGAPRACYASLMGLTIFGFLTWIFAMAARDLRAGEDYEASGSHEGAKALFAWALDLLGPVGVAIIGGVISLLYAAAAVMNFRRPPVMLILQAERHKPQGAIVTALKYGVLLVVWAFLAWVFLAN